MAFEIFLSRQFEIGISLLTVASLLMIVQELNSKKFKLFKRTILLILGSSILFILGSLLYPISLLNITLTTLGALGFLLGLFCFGARFLYLFTKGTLV